LQFHSKPQGSVSQKYCFGVCGNNVNTAMGKNLNSENYITLLAFQGIASLLFIS